MKSKIVTVLVLSVVASFVCGRMLFAQYTGGSYDGYAKGSFSLSMPVTTGYTGGNGDGYAKGSFTGSLWMPTVTTGSATNVTANSATLNGTVNANGTSTTAWFQYGAVSGSYTGTSTTEAVSGTSATPVSIGISSLSSGTIYYYRIAANNSAGTSTGSEASFTTSSSSGGGGGGGVIEKLTISSTSPSSGATGVSVDSTVSATFSMYIKGSTLTTDTFKLSGGDGDVSGSVSTDGIRLPLSLPVNWRTTRNSRQR